MDRFNALRIFVAVADAGSFAAGARSIGISAPSATRGINALEDSLGTRLFNRTTRVVRLTDAGRAYLKDVRVILADLEAASETVSGVLRQPKGMLRVTTPVEFGRIHIAPIVAEYLDLFPDVTVDVLMVDRPVNLAQEGLDVGTSIGSPATSGLIAEKVGQVRWVVCGTPAYFEQHGRPETPDDLAEHRLICATSAMEGNEWRFGKAEDIMVRLTPRMSVSSVAAATDLVRQGWGVTRTLSYFVGEDIDAGRMEIVLEAFEPEPLPIQLLHLEERRTSTTVRSFLDLARKRLGEAPALQ